jgi:hypothetical protein
MKVRVDRDEMYPVYMIAGSTNAASCPVLEITEEEARQIERSWEVFKAAQDILARAYYEAEARRAPSTAEST